MFSHRFVIILSVVLYFMILPAHAQNGFTPQASITLPAELDRILRDYEKAWTGGEAAKLASLFVDDGYVPTNAGWIRGHKKIMEKYAETGGDLQLRAINYATEGQVGFIVGAYGYGPDAATRDRGNFVLALRRSPEGKWLIVADLDKANR